jgi:hypothetical protein
MVMALLWGLLGLSGCGSAADGPTPPPTPAPSPTQEKKKNLIEWILDLGAGSPPGPARAYFDAYEELRKQNCDAALRKADEPHGRRRIGDDDAFTVLSAAAMACLAAMESRDELWTGAKQVRDSTDPATLHCLDAAAYALLDSLIDAHDAHPDRSFQFTAGGTKGKPPCPHITGITPREGAPGAVVTITGANLERVTRIDVVVNGSRLESFDPNLSDGALRITMPAADEGTTAVVVIVTKPGGWKMDEAEFRYRR